ncbi:uncharacterized protein LOC100577425 [Apis mellifera]|uniref:Uncharacterized protein LOC100577425 n=1 Tax=Apis mellifera TaxID=7460 RepID=A0A7M7MTV0_APIME|nr:uncharacterized protein LOC100577425 [Apis mellifera]|eukprot:XP_026300779.1 uncharacterized protein LOC100577425 [Apis mellifera]
MKLCVCPEKGEILAGNTQKMEIIITPIKEGVVQSLFIPCFVGNLHKIIILGIECFIEPLYVTFYFPLNDKMSLELNNNFVKVEWRTDSFKFAFDMAEKSKKYMKILNKYKNREEREIMNMDLDQGEILKDASTDPLIQETIEESNEYFPNTSEINNFQTSNLRVQIDNNYSQNTISSGNIIPFHQRYLPLITQPIVIEFLNLPLRTVRKKTFIIKNETSIPTNFWLSIKNFYPIRCVCEWKSKKDLIKSIYKRVFGQKKGLVEETLYKAKQSGSGIVIYVDPLNSDIGPFKAISVDIYVFADTWGIYMDELEINIIGLPKYTIGICVQVVGSPITLSISDRNEFNIPVIKYGIEAIGMRLNERKILLTNTSVIPIAINWHTFLVKPIIKKMPFNILFSIQTPFTDKLAAQLRLNNKKTESEIHLEEHTNFSSSKNLNTCDSFEINDITDSTTSSYMESSFITSSGISNSEILINKHSKNKCDNLKCNHNHKHDCKICLKNSKRNDIELKILILPYYGLINTKICKVKRYLKIKYFLNMIKDFYILIYVSRLLQKKCSFHPKVVCL